MWHIRNNLMWIRIPLFNFMLIRIRFRINIILFRIRILLSWGRKKKFFIRMREEGERCGTTKEVVREVGWGSRVWKIKCECCGEGWGSEQGSYLDLDLDPDPWKILFIWQNYADPQHCFYAILWLGDLPPLHLLSVLMLSYLPVLGNAVQWLIPRVQ